MELIAALSALPMGAQILPVLLFLNVWVIAPSLHAPTPDSGFWYRVAYRLSTVLAGNYARARNADDVALPPYSPVAASKWREVRETHRNGDLNP